MTNLTISEVLGNSFPSSWNLNLQRNFIDLEIELERFMSSLNLVDMSSSTTNPKGWFLSSTGSFWVKSKPYNPITFHSANFVWKSEVQGICLISVDKIVNTDDMIQVKRSYKCISPPISAFFAEGG